MASMIKGNFKEIQIIFIKLFYIMSVETMRE